MTKIPAFLMGFLATTFQIYLLREFSVHFYGNELNYGFVLASWLLWGGLGSLSASRIRIPLEKLDGVYETVIVLGMAAFVALRFSRFVLGRFQGELAGMIPALLFSLGLCFLAGFPLGLLFVFNARLNRGDVPRVYFFEAAGAAAGAVLVDLCLVPLFSNWQGVAIASAGAAAAVFFTIGHRKTPGRSIVVLACLAAFASFDLPAQRLWWKPFSLVRTKDTPYGKLQLIKRQDQISLYSSGLPLFTCPDPAFFEESVHFALLQRPAAGRILLVGGGIGGGLRELLQYKNALVDYVELDPGIIRIAAGALPDKEKEALASPRVRTVFEDGRAFLLKSKTAYDAVVLNLPEPSSVRINRFYTVEFFRLAASHLAPGGVLSFSLPSAENYISPELGEFLSMLHGTLMNVFPRVLVVPGDINIFLASTGELTLDADLLARRMAELGLRTVYLTPKRLSARLDPGRVAYLREKAGASPDRLNRDLAPAGTYLHSILWCSQFRGWEAGMLQFLARIPGHLLLEGPVALYLLILFILFFRRKRGTGMSRVPLWTMGLTTIIVELAVVILYQTEFGYVYGKIALLLAVFMGGTALGAVAGISRKRTGAADAALPQGGFLVLLAALRLGLAGGFPEAAFFIILSGFGIAGGFLFVAVSRLEPRESTDYGSGYAADLLGSFAGALVTAAFIIPLAGIPALLDRLLLINSFCLLFILFRSSSASGPIKTG